MKERPAASLDGFTCTLVDSQVRGRQRTSRPSRLAGVRKHRCDEDMLQLPEEDAEKEARAAAELLENAAKASQEPH